MPVILGINAYHGDASAALVSDGRCIAAAAEERFSRIKHQAGLPSMAAQWCLDSNGLTWKDLDLVAVSRKPSAHLARKLTYSVSKLGSMSKSLKQRVANAAKVMDVRSALADALGVGVESMPQLSQIEHHRAHLASAFICSPFERAACLSLDGMGDFVSTMWGRGQGSEISVDGYVPYPHSLGIFYTAFTQFLGLPNYGDEYKLMGLSAYGEPSMKSMLEEVISLGKDLQFKLNLDYFTHHSHGVDMTWDSGVPTIGRLWSDRMIEVFGPERTRQAEVSDRDRDLAASVQAHLEDLILEQLRRLHARIQTPNLVLAGGVALNCVVNGMIREKTPFEQVWIQPASTDDGTAVGAALWAWAETTPNAKRWQMEHAYLGPEFSEAEYKSALDASQTPYELLPDEQLFERVASRLVEGSIVGWFQGKMEFGPRALGNRSIVCDPRRAEMKDILNSRIKHRESFRPFAPSILEERTGDWFEQDYPSPFMHMAYLVRPEKREQIPAVTHEDGTARLQTVSKGTNPRYHRLISEFEKHSGVPVVLNTSFNENEPIVLKPSEGIDCFARNDMDVLVLGNFLVERKP